MLCTDVDECLNKSCDGNAACTNTDGSFTCACNAGYAGDGAVCTAASTQQVNMVVQLPYSVETFTAALQLRFRESVASAADTPVEKVGSLHEECRRARRC